MVFLLDAYKNHRQPRPTGAPCRPSSGGARSKELPRSSAMLGYYPPYSSFLFKERAFPRHFPKHGWKATQEPTSPMRCVSARTGSCGCMAGTSHVATMSFKAGRVSLHAQGPHPLSFTIVTSFSTVSAFEICKHLHLHLKTFL